MLDCLRLEIDYVSVIEKWGNSGSVRIPRIIMDSLNLKFDDPLDIKEENGKIIIAPVKTDEFELEELLAGITPENLHERADFGSPAGKELL